MTQGECGLGETNQKSVGAFGQNGREFDNIVSELQIWIVAVKADVNPKSVTSTQLIDAHDTISVPATYEREVVSNSIKAARGSIKEHLQERARDSTQEIMQRIVSILEADEMTEEEIQSTHAVVKEHFDVMKALDAENFQFFSVCVDLAVMKYILLKQMEKPGNLTTADVDRLEAAIKEAAPKIDHMKQEPWPAVVGFSMESTLNDMVQFQAGAQGVLDRLHSSREMQKSDGPPPAAPQETPEVDKKFVAEAEKFLKETQEVIDHIPPVRTDRASFVKVMAGKGTDKNTKGISGTKLVDRRRRLQSLAENEKNREEVLSKKITTMSGELMSLVTTFAIVAILDNPRPQGPKFPKKLVQQVRGLVKSAADEHVKIPDEIQEEAEVFIQTHPESSSKRIKKQAEGEDQAEPVPEAQAVSSPDAPRRKRSKVAPPAAAS